jgi:DNA repair exonuclease SbcCD ATPase subunit
MSLDYIRLKGFTRFSLNEIDVFEMRIVSDIVILIGKNGAGKSSLLEQLTSWPPSQQDFLKTGEKHTEHTHNGKQYVLKAVFSPSAKYYFEVDGKVLNNWGTMAIQKELVTAHFGINANTHSLSIGNERFHQMKPMRRKEWLVALCETNYDYAISVYNRVRERLRDVQGALKTAKKKITVETEKQLKSDEEQALIRDVEELHTCVNVLIEARKPLDRSVSDIEEDKQAIELKIKQTHSKYKSVLASIGEWVLLNEEQYARIVQKLSSRISVQQALMSRASQEYDNNKKRIDLLKIAEAQTAETLRQEILNIRFEAATVSNKLIVSLDGENAEHAQEVFLSAKNTLADIYSEIPTNTDSKYSSKKLNDIRNEIARLSTLIENANRKQAHLEERIKHLEAHRHKKDIKCVNCAFEFSLQFDENALNNHTRDLAVTKAEIEKLKAQREQSQEYEASCSEYARLYRQYIQLINSAPKLTPYWDYLQGLGLFATDPKSGINAINAIERDLSLQCQLQKLQQVEKEKSKLLQTVISAEQVTGDLKTLTKANEALEQEIQASIEMITMLQIRKQHYAELQVQKRFLDNTQQRLEQLSQTKMDLLATHIEAIRRTIYNDVVRTVQSTLATKEHLLSQSRSQKAVIQMLSDQITELEKEEQAFSALSKVLSPNEGLIAEGLFGFIKTFTKKMNVIIRKTWTYEMAIQPCMLAGEEIDLDYLFPVVIKGDTKKPRPDVSKTSEGQKEIIDMAFLVTAMSYLGASKNALILDEIGSAFDEEHKDALTVLLKLLIEQKSFDQIFMVSHDKHQYNALNAQLVTLCAPGAAQVRGFNEHVTIA